MKGGLKTIAFVASSSGMGKTSLMEAVLTLLKAKGYMVGAVKHSGHNVAMDREGSDSWRFRRAGSDVGFAAAGPPQSTQGCGPGRVVRQ